MKVTLVSWLYSLETLDKAIEDVGEDRTVVPTSLLSIGAILENKGHRVKIVDPNLLRTYGDSYTDIAKKIVEISDTKIYGFSTASGIFHHSLQLSEEVKKLRPDSVILFGGPHVSVIDELTLQLFSWIDIIIRGEAEQVVPIVVDRLEGNFTLDNVTGITYRKNSQIIRTPEAELIKNLDDLPLPAYDLYPMQKNTIYSLPLEAGRGCPYPCTFCSTNLFWGRQFRMKSVKRLISEIENAKKRFHFETVYLRHDNFLVDRNFVIDFSRAMKESKLDVNWVCSGRIDNVDPELLKIMADGKCSTIEYGVESGSEHVQDSIKKCLNEDQIRRMVKATIDARIKPALFFMCGFPEENTSDLKKTLKIIGELFLVYKDKGYSQILVLYPFPKTEMTRKYKDRLQFYPNRLLLEALKYYPKKFLELAKKYPELFPELYIIKNSYGIKPDEFFKLELFIWRVFQLLTINFPWTMSIVMQQLNGDLELFYKEFPNLENITMDQALIVENFPRCLSSISQKNKIQFPPYTLELWEYEKTMFFALNDYKPANQLSNGGLDNKVRIKLSPNAVIRRFKYDIPSLIRQLKDDIVPNVADNKETIILFLPDSNEHILSLLLDEDLAKILPRLKDINSIGELELLMGDNNLSSQLLQQLIDMGIIISTKGLGKDTIVPC